MSLPQHFLRSSLEACSRVLQNRGFRVGLVVISVAVGTVSVLSAAAALVATRSSLRSDFCADSAAISTLNWASVDVRNENNIKRTVATVDDGTNIKRVTVGVDNIGNADITSELRYRQIAARPVEVYRVAIRAQPFSDMISTPKTEQVNPSSDQNSQKFKIAKAFRMAQAGAEEYKKCMEDKRGAAMWRYVGNMFAHMPMGMRFRNLFSKQLE